MQNNISDSLGKVEQHENVGVCVDNSKVKNYMDYRVITATTSDQYRYIQAHTTVNEHGLLVTSDGYVGVAMGSIYGEIGSKYIVTTDTTQFKVVKVDEKSDEHTINGCYHSWNNSIIEFVIDTNLTQKSYSFGMQMGDFDYEEQFTGMIIKIEKEK